MSLMWLTSSVAYCVAHELAEVIEVRSSIHRSSGLQIRDSPNSTQSCSLTIASWLHVSMGTSLRRGKGTHQDHCEKNDDEAKNSFGGCDA